MINAIMGSIKLITQILSNLLFPKWNLNVNIYIIYLGEIEIRVSNDSLQQIQQHCMKIHFKDHKERKNNTEQIFG